MSWDRKRNGRCYYYRSKRINGRCAKEYVGTGPRAERAARLDEERRRRRRAEYEACLAEQVRVDAADQALGELWAMCTLLARAALISGGYYEHRGEWRKRQGHRGRGRR